MAIPLELSFRNLERSDFIEDNIKQKLKRLELLSDVITFCHVVVGAPHKHQKKGNNYEIHIELGVPGTELAATRNVGVSDAHENVYVAVRDAFEALERQLDRWKDKHSIHVKRHSRPSKPVVQAVSEIPDET